ncbi:uncharacterized protein B0H18DRAFT_962308 [Fomitopsis serialis]|uniref:uncharacterized protein n=1 Tax=Fomitopsis serialis TaxID=139415 RepID=UPI002008524C|nr:uncharacterized protein B0H18DRAFT_962308 [Neoantrodia serialis]KAH9911347.1 hypothetical protein B0H18DRAFT_962308 [Neoantrodia serialis]
MSSPSTSSSHHAGPAAAADPLHGYNNPLDANLLLAAYGRNIETRLKQSENPRLQNRKTIARFARYWIAAAREWVVYVPPLAISAMEEVAGNMSGDYPTRMARIKSDDPRVFTNAWYTASPPPGVAPLPGLTGMATSSAPRNLHVPNSPEKESPAGASQPTTSHTAHAVRFALPHARPRPADRNDPEEADVTPGTAVRPGQVKRSTTGWDYLEISDDKAEHDVGVGMVAGPVTFTGQCHGNNNDTSDEEDELQEPGIPTDRRIAAGRAKGKRPASDIDFSDEEDQLLESEIPTKTINQRGQAKKKQRADSATVKVQQVKRDAPVLLRPALKNPLSGGPSAGDVNHGPADQYKVDQALKIRDINALIDIVQGERAVKRLPKFNWDAGKIQGRRKAIWLRTMPLQEPPCTRCSGIHCWISSDPNAKRPATKCDEIGRQRPDRSPEGIELLETTADVSYEVRDLRQENAKIRTMCDELRQDFATLREHVKARTLKSNLQTISVLPSTVNTGPEQQQRPGQDACDMAIRDDGSDMEISSDDPDEV